MKRKGLTKSARTEGHVSRKCTQVLPGFGSGHQLLRGLVIVFADHFQHNVSVAVLVERANDDLCVEELFADHTDQTSDDSAQALAFAVVMQMHCSVGGVGHPEGGRPHARVYRAEVVVEIVQVGEEVVQIAAQHAQDLIVAILLAVFEKVIAKRLQTCVDVEA